MMLFNALLLAFREIRRNVLRAVLTTLGIVIGVSSVITMITIGNAATRQVSQKISNLGSNLIMVHPIRGMSGGGSSRTSSNFSINDIDNIKSLPNIAAVAPNVQRTARMVYQQKNWAAPIIGTTPDYFTVKQLVLISGRPFNDIETRIGRPVCVIGQTTRKELFNAEDPIGAQIRINNKVNCEVIGLLPEQGQSIMGTDQDDVVIAPLNLVRKQIIGRSTSRDITSIMISAEQANAIPDLIEEITALLRQSRQLGNNEDNDFNVMDTKQIGETLSTTTKTLTVLLGTIAGVSLLVGGIGIMNIMLVSVTERTREIGIRMAIGALSREVLLQFLVEAVVLSSLGGLVGILLALAASLGLTQAMNLPFEFDYKINVIAFMFSALVGIIFGYMPAKRAAQLDPINALRHE